MRGNGLTADDYAPIAYFVDRSVAADALLALREEGIAAYVVLPEQEPAHTTVFADRTALEQAREVVRALGTGDADHTVDDAWTRIVSGWERTAHVPEEEHFIPPDPPPPPRLPPMTRLAWTGVFGGPAVLLASVLLSWSPPRQIVLAALLAFVGGIVMLVFGMDDRPPSDSGPDNGAVL